MKRRVYFTAGVKRLEIPRLPEIATFRATRYGKNAPNSTRMTES
jgi:hypothetical protein